MNPRPMLLLLAFAVTASPAAAQDPRFTTYDPVAVGSPNGVAIGGTPAGFDVVARDVDSVNIDRIESTNMRESVLGRILGYGLVEVHGTGVGEIDLPTIADPIGFRRALVTAMPGGALQG